MEEDIEELQAEVEEKEEQVKQYYEALEEWKSRMAMQTEEIERLRRKQQTLEYQKEVLELERDPVQEGGNDEIEVVYSKLEAQAATIASRDKEIAKLRTQLDQHTLQVTDSPARGGGGGGSAPGATGEDSDDYAGLIKQEKARDEQEKRRLEADARKSAAEADRAAQAAASLQRRVEQAEATANEARRAQAAAEAAVRQKDGEVLKLIKERDAAIVGKGGGGGGGRAADLQEQLNEKEDEMYTLQTDLDDARDKVEELEKLRDELLDKMSRGDPRVNSMQMELDDMREKTTSCRPPPPEDARSCRARWARAWMNAQRWCGRRRRHDRIIGQQSVEVVDALRARHCTLPRAAPRRSGTGEEHDGGARACAANLNAVAPAARRVTAVSHACGSPSTLRSPRRPSNGASKRGSATDLHRGRSSPRRTT